MSESTKRIVIVGAGQAGGHAAMAARKVAPGSSIVLIGNEAFPPYERPPLSKAVLTGAMEFEKTFLQPAVNYQDNGIVLRLGHDVVSIDRAAQRLQIEGKPSEPYDSLILTTGASARRLPIPGGDARNVFYVRSIADTLAIREAMKGAKRLVVVGAGLIGLEIAASAKASVSEVVVLEAASRPMQRVMAPEVSEFFRSMHERRGVDIRFNTGVISIEDQVTGLRIETSSGPIEADLVVVGIGATPNQELASRAGLLVDDGVVVDEFCRTSDAAISAAGDLTKHFNPIVNRHVRLESWQNAQNQGIAVGRNVGGDPTPYVEVPWFWSDQFDINFQSVGWVSDVDSVVWRGDQKSGPFMALYIASGKLVGASAVNSGRDVRHARTLIAQQREIDPSDLADTSRKLADLCKAVVPAPVS